MKQSFFKKILLSIKSPTFLANTVKEKFTSVLVYMTLLLLIVGAITGIIKTYVFVNDMKQFTDVVKGNDFPEFELKDGIFSIDTKEPIVIEVQDQLIFIVDENGDKNINDLAGYQTGYLITHEGLTISMIGRNPNYYDFGLIKQFYFSKKELVQQLELTVLVSKFVLPFIVIIFTFIANIFRSLFIFLIALSIRNASRMTHIKTSKLYQMALYSMTIGILLYEFLALITLFITLPVWLLNFSILTPFLLFYMPSSIVLFKGFKQLVVLNGTKVEKNDKL